MAAICESVDSPNGAEVDTDFACAKGGVLEHEPLRKDDTHAGLFAQRIKVVASLRTRIQPGDPSLKVL